ncbi:restriction endonuclease subunit S [Pseudomonas sp. Pseusp97]|uniref:restriction endonuclease subunit S n=1 Tax=Pseudomonas sp. Pseusp97 TaxID=3243065 RepID=UPI0039A761DF
MSSEVLWSVLGDVVEEIIDRRGVTPLKLGGDFTSSGHRVISAKLIKGGRVQLDADEPRFVDSMIYKKWMRTPLRAGDVLMTSEAPVGELAYLERDRGWVLGQRLFALRPKGNVLDGKYLYYALRTDQVRAEIFGRATGTTVQGIRQAELRLVKVPVPPIGVQRSVAETLSSLDDRISLIRESNATLEAIAQTLFKSWFVDFDPVRAKAEGRQPDGMDAATAALFPDSFDESELGSFPAGWEVRPIGEMVEGIYDGPHATPPEANEGPVFLGIKNLTGASLDLSEVRYINENDWKHWTRRVEPRHGDIVFSYEATLGFFALIPPDVRCCLGRRLALVRPHSENGAGLFWFHQFISKPFQQMLEKNTIHGATVNRIALKAFPSYQVLNPTKALKLAFDSSVSPLWAQIHRNQAQAHTLTQLRDALLPRLISGQLRLPEAEALAAGDARACAGT